MMQSQKTYTVLGQQKTVAEIEKMVEAYAPEKRSPHARHTVISKHVPEKSYVLDYGCGWGTLSKIVHDERGCRVDGIDPDKSSIEIAKDVVGETDTLNFSVKSIEAVPDETYDVVVSTQVIEHTFNPGMYLNHCNRVLKPQGFLIISLPNIMTPKLIWRLFRCRSPQAAFQKISSAIKNHDQTHDHIQGWDPMTFCALLCGTGFEYVAHAFLEGASFPKNRYWRKPWGTMKNFSYTMMFKAQKLRYMDIQPTR